MKRQKRGNGGSSRLTSLNIAQMISDKETFRFCAIHILSVWSLNTFLQVHREYDSMQFANVRSDADVYNRLNLSHGTIMGNNNKKLTELKQKTFSREDLARVLVHEAWRFVILADVSRVVGVSSAFVWMSVCLFFRMISQKLMKIGSPNLRYKHSMTSPGNPFILGSKGQMSKEGNWSPKQCRRGSLNSCECWLLIVCHFALSSFPRLSKDVRIMCIKIVNHYRIRNWLNSNPFILLSRHNVRVLKPKRHWFDLLWICCGFAQQIEQANQFGFVIRSFIFPPSRFTKSVGSESATSRDWFVDDLIADCYTLTNPSQLRHNTLNQRYALILISVVLSRSAVPR